MRIVNLEYLAKYEEDVGFDLPSEIKVYSDGKFYSSKRLYIEAIPAKFLKPSVNSAGNMFGPLSYTFGIVSSEALKNTISQIPEIENNNNIQQELIDATDRMLFNTGSRAAEMEEFIYNLIFKNDLCYIMNDKTRINLTEDNHFTKDTGQITYKIYQVIYAHVNMFFFFTGTRKIQLDALNFIMNE